MMSAGVEACVIPSLNGLYTGFIPRSRILHVQRAGEVFVPLQGVEASNVSGVQRKQERV